MSFRLLFCVTNLSIVSCNLFTACSFSANSIFIFNASYLCSTSLSFASCFALWTDLIFTTGKRSIERSYQSMV